MKLTFKTYSDIIISLTGDLDGVELETTDGGHYNRACLAAQDARNLASLLIKVADHVDELNRTGK